LLHCGPSDNFCYLGNIKNLDVDDDDDNDDEKKKKFYFATTMIMTMIMMMTGAEVRVR